MSLEGVLSIQAAVHQIREVDEVADDCFHILIEIQVLAEASQARTSVRVWIWREATAYAPRNFICSGMKLEDRRSIHMCGEYDVVQGDDIVDVEIKCGVVDVQRVPKMRKECQVNSCSFFTA